MTIDELNALTTLTAADEVPVWDSEESGEPTKKITASNLAASVKSLASLPNTTEMNTAIAQSTASTGNIHGTSTASDTTTQTLIFTADGGQKVRMTIAKLGDNRNYVQFWLGDTLVDRGYIIFDVSRNNT